MLDPASDTANNDAHVIMDHFVSGELSLPRRQFAETAPNRQKEEMK
jgi:hypothetical protein